MLFEVLLLDRHIGYQYITTNLSQIVTCFNKVISIFVVPLQPYFAC